MAKMNDTGVYQLANKNWAFRYTITADGRKKDVRKAKDEFGNPLNLATDLEKLFRRLIILLLLQLLML